jgi:hypothetical protein
MRAAPHHVHRHCFASPIEREHFHGLEQVLSITATTVVASKRDVRPSIVVAPERRETIQQFQVAHRIEGEVHAGRAESRDLLISHPKGVSDGELRTYQPEPSEMIEK